MKLTFREIYAFKTDNNFKEEHVRYVAFSKNYYTMEISNDKSD